LAYEVYVPTDGASLWEHLLMPAARSASSPMGWRRGLLRVKKGHVAD
jgi:hypothetical protein